MGNFFLCLEYIDRAICKISESSSCNEHSQKKNNMPIKQASVDGAATLGRGQIYPLTNYKRGARVWIRDPELVWVAAYLNEDVSFQTRVVRLTLEDGKVKFWKKKFLTSRYPNCPLPTSIHCRSSGIRIF